MQATSGTSVADDAGGDESTAPAADEHASMVRLPVVSDVAAAASVKAELAPLLPAGRGVRMLADDVERITTACIQVLLAADHALLRRGAGLSVSGATEAMRAAFADLGLSADLERWIDAHG